MGAMNFREFSMCETKEDTFKSNVGNILVVFPNENFIYTIFALFSVFEPKNTQHIRNVVQKSES